MKKQKKNNLELEVMLLQDLLEADIYNKVIKDYDKILRYETLKKENEYLRKKNKELKNKLMKEGIKND